MVTEVIVDAPLLLEILYMEPDRIDSLIDHKEEVFKLNGVRHLVLLDLIHFIIAFHNLECSTVPQIISFNPRLICLV
jgi:hypothetical protein